MYVCFPDGLPTVYNKLLLTQLLLLHKMLITSDEKLTVYNNHLTQAFLTMQNAYN